MSQASFIFAIATIEATIIAMGIIGNVISIIIFSRKTFRSNSISTYCIALAIFDISSVTQLVTDVYTLMYGTFLPDQNNTFCKFYFYSLVLLSSIQAWVMVAFSLDKLLSMRVRSIALLKKKWFQLSIVAGVVIFSAGLYLYIPILLRVREIFPGFSLCDSSTLGFFNVHIILYTFETCLIPFLFMIISSILTVRLLIKSRKAVATNEQMARDRKSKDRKYAITSITFNVLFVLLKLSGAVFYIMSAFYNYFDLYFYFLCYLFFYLNSSMGFFVHLVTNSLFRRELLVLFRLADEVTVQIQIAEQILRVVEIKYQLLRNQVPEINYPQFITISS